LGGVVGGNAFYPPHVPNARYFQGDGSGSRRKDKYTEVHTDTDGMIKCVDLLNEITLKLDDTLFSKVINAFFDVQIQIQFIRLDIERRLA
jgi:hypothetical protein